MDAETRQRFQAGVCGFSARGASAGSASAPAVGGGLSASAPGRFDAQAVEPDAVARGCDISSADLYQRIATADKEAFQLWKAMDGSGKRALFDPDLSSSTRTKLARVWNTNDDVAGSDVEKALDVIKNTDGSGRAFIADADEDTLRKFLTIDNRASGTVDWAEWRETVVGYRANPGIDGQEIDSFIKQSYRLSTSNKVKGSVDEFHEEMERMPVGPKKTQPTQFRQLNNEVRRTHEYAFDRDVGLGNKQVQKVKVEFPEDAGDNDKDIDLKVTYGDGTDEYVELKRLNKRSGEGALRKNLYTGDNAANKKYEKLETRMDDGEKTVELSIEYSDRGISSKQKLRSIVNDISDGRDTAFNKIRVVPRNSNAEPFHIVL